MSAEQTVKDAQFARNDWQPIETAPKAPVGRLEEGPPILLWLPPDSLELYRVNVGYWWPLFDSWCRANPAEGDTKFWCEPTHWMPLPEPPSQNG